MANVTKKAATAAPQFGLVTLAGATSEVSVSAGETAVPYGQVTDSVVAGGRVNVQTSSPDTKLIASAAIQDGALLMGTAGGKVATAAGATNIVIGRALEAATGDGHIFRAELFAHKIALGGA